MTERKCFKWCEGERLRRETAEVVGESEYEALGNFEGLGS